MDREAQLEEFEALSAIYASNFLPDDYDAKYLEDLSATARAEVELPEDGLILEVHDSNFRLKSSLNVLHHLHAASEGPHMHIHMQPITS